LRSIKFITNAFPIWIIAASIVAMIKPAVFTWFRGDMITYGLGVIMLGMGITLHPIDFHRVMRSPKWVLSGVILQYTVMPLMGWGLGYLMNLPTVLAIGLIIVACCPGGTASNVISFLARANVALSVTMTAISTILAIALTPVLTTFLIGDRLEVSALQLFLGTLKVVLAPVLAGVLLNRYFHTTVKKIQPIAPLIAVIAIVLIVASIIGQGKDEIVKSGLELGMAVLILHTTGFTLGYFFSKWYIRDEMASQTVSIEVGMQNSGLGAYLAQANFANPATAIPSAMSSAVHCVLGSLAAALFRRSGNKQSDDYSQPGHPAVIETG